MSGVLVGIIFSIEQESFGTEGQRGENLQWLLWCAGQRYDDDVMNLECIARTGAVLGMEREMVLGMGCIYGCCGKGVCSSRNRLP